MRQITDAQRQVTITRKFNPKWLVINPKWLLIGLILACVIGGSVGGYYFYNEVTSTAVQPKPPVQPGVVPPTTPSEAPTPTQPENEIQATWKSYGPAGVKEVLAVIIEDDGLYVLGNPPESFRTVNVWETKDEGVTWELLGLLTDPKITLKEKEVLIQHLVVNPSFNLQTWESRTDPNNPNIILQPHNRDTNGQLLKGPAFRLSFDGGNSWSKLVLPTPLASFYNPLQTEKYHFALISDRKNLKLFFAYTNQVWQAKINLPE